MFPVCLVIVVKFIFRVPHCVLVSSFVIGLSPQCVTMYAFSLLQCITVHVTMYAFRCSTVYHSVGYKRCMQCITVGDSGWRQSLTWVWLHGSTRKLSCSRKCRERGVRMEKRNRQATEIELGGIQWLLCLSNLFLIAAYTQRTGGQKASLPWYNEPMSVITYFPKHP